MSLYSDFLLPGSTVLAEWNFPSVGADAVADAGIAANSTKTISTVGGTGTVLYTSGGATTNSASADTWTSGSGVKYWQVELETTGFSQVAVSSKQRSSGTGPRDFALEYKIGAGGTWTAVGGGTVLVGNDVAMTIGSLSNVQLPVACSNQASVFLRWIMTSNTSQNGGTVAGTGTSRIDDIVITGRVPSFVSGYENLSTGNVTSTMVSGLAALTDHYYRVRSTGGTCSTGGNSNTIMVTTAAVPVYYSRATGNVTDPVWSDTPNGTAGAATFSDLSSMIVQATHTITNTGSVTVKNVSVDAGGTLVLNSASLFKTTAGASVVAGTITANDNSSFQIAEGTTATLAITGTVSFYDFKSQMLTSTTVTGGMDIRGTLTLDDGVFDASGATVTLKSTATSTGRLGIVAPTASYTGNMTIERYRPAGLTNWMLLGSPINSRKVSHWQDDFVTAGYPGSQFPGFLGNDNNPWPSIRWYDETNTGVLPNDGMTGVSSQLQALTTGQGFAVWAGTGLINTTAFTVDLGNQTPTIAQTPITLPMTYTNTGNPSNDGWNLVSNPVPSPIAFDQIVRGSDVGDFITYYNPANGNTAVYDISLNLGTNNASNTIQSMQGFFLKATGSNVTTTVDENAKVSGNGGGMFGSPNSRMLRLSMTSQMNEYSDETVVVLDEGTAAHESNDVDKYVWAHDNAPQIASIADGVQLAINAYGSADTGIDVPVSVNAGVTGEYTITLTQVGDLGLTCITLEDLALGTITPMDGGGTYTFTLGADDDATVARFVLHATAPMPFATTDALCGANPDGHAEVTVVNGPNDVLWTDDLGNTILSDVAVDGISTITNLAPGSYQVHVLTTSACGALVRDFTIEAPFVLEAQGVVADATCANSADGGIDLITLGGTAPFNYLWNDAAATTAEDLVAAPGTYNVTVTDGNGCVWTSPAFVIADQGPDVTIDAASTATLAGVELLFNSNQANVSYAWDFGDGSTSTEQSPVHAWSLPGIYTVTLTVSDGTCSATTTVEVTVDVNTGVTTIAAGAATRVWAASSNIVIEHGYS
ncbi:MAG TPA: PKD domain-containing protein, partial [Flavobacteriales bacterium]|nr:PKD domain-containing protein [Flavobacteriales bacterium]